jgi:Icc protein
VAAYPGAVRLVDPEPRPLTELAYACARPGGGTSRARLRIVGMRVDRLPAGCDALLVASDLQGVAPSPWGGEPRLLGAALAEYLEPWSGLGWLPPPGKLGVLLGGDLYSAPGADIRGASGDVTAVWQAFVRAGCPVVAGVLGNHDDVGDGVTGDGRLHLLDGEVAALGGIRVGGVGRVIGEPGRMGRRAEAEQLAALRAVLAEQPDVLVVHEGPAAGAGQRGSPRVTAALDDHDIPLVVCGHVHWTRPVAPRRGGHVLNVDSRVVVLTT